MELKQFTRYLDIIFLNKINHVLSLLKFFILYKKRPGDYCERNTRSHSELGSQAFQRRWYLVLRLGRVGRCQANPNENIHRNNWWSRFCWISFNEHFLKKQNIILLALTIILLDQKKTILSQRKLNI